MFFILHSVTHGVTANAWNSNLKLLKLVRPVMCLWSTMPWSCMADYPIRAADTWRQGLRMISCTFLFVA